MARPASKIRLAFQVAAALLAVYLCLIAAALHKRDTSLDALNERIVRDATASAEHGPADYDKYLYSYPDMPWQTGAVYLFEHGRCDPRVERIVLLYEARRSYDGQYISSYALNTDLRHWLIARCLQQYPDDARVAWAVGRQSLILGDFDVAADQLTRARALGLDPADIGEPAWALYGRLITASGLSGRYEELEPLFKAGVAAHPNDAAALGALAEYYCLCDRQDDAIALLKDAPALATDARLEALLRRAYWWGGHLAEYRAQAALAAAAEGTELYSFDPRLALLDGDQAAFDLRLPSGNSLRWRALADVYAVTRRANCIKELEQTARYFINAPRDGLSWDAQDDLEKNTILANNELARALILSGNWTKAVATNQESATIGSYHYYYDYRMPSQACTEFLTSTYSNAMDENTSWELSCLGQALPSLLLSRSFAEAIEHSGMSRQEVLAQLTADMHSYPSNYYDYGNGVFNPSCAAAPAIAAAPADAAATH